MTYPNSNLPTVSQAWGRAIQKDLTNITAQFLSERTNNAARDAQLQASYKRLDTTVLGVSAATTAAAQAAADAAQAAADAQDAIDGLTSLGSISSPYTINAGNINAGTLTGVTIQTANSGRRVVLSGDDIEFYDYAILEGVPYLTYGGHITSLSLNDYLGSGLSITGPSDGGALIASNYTKINGAGPDFGGSVVVGQTPETSGVRISGNNIDLTGVVWIYGNTRVSSASTLTVDGTLYAPTVSSSTSFAGNLSTNGSLTRTALATGASTTCTINGSGQFVRTTSSARYKQDIQPLEVNYDELLSLEPKRFRLKEEAETNPDARFYAGFIAEEIDQTSLKDFVGYSKQEDGSVIPESVYYAEMTAALLAGLKKQDSMIKELQEQVALLEAK